MIQYANGGQLTRKPIRNSLP